MENLRRDEALSRLRLDKPLDEFWLNKSSPDGRATYCILCFKFRNRASAERERCQEGRTRCATVEARPSAAYRR